jgi:acetoin utilization protein AcuB
MSVQTIMTRTVVCAAPTTTVREAIRLIEDSDVRHLPIVDGRELLGIVSDRDLREYRIPLYVEIEQMSDADRARADELLDTPLGEVMSEEVISVEGHESIASVVDAMLEYKVGAVPVVNDDNELLGIVSYIDVLKYTLELMEG